MSQNGACTGGGVDRFRFFCFVFFSVADFTLTWRYSAFPRETEHNTGSKNNLGINHTKPLLPDRGWAPSPIWMDGGLSPQVSHHLHHYKQQQYHRTSIIPPAETPSGAYRSRMAPDRPLGLPPVVRAFRLRRPRIHRPHEPRRPHLLPLPPTARLVLLCLFCYFFLLRFPQSPPPSFAGFRTLSQGRVLPPLLNDPLADRSLVGPDRSGYKKCVPTCCVSPKKT